MRAPKVKTEIRQEQIAHSALKLIAQHGFHQLSVAQVANAIGVVPSAIYRHYKSKDQILDEVLELISTRLRENVRSARQQKADPLECVECILLQHVELVRNEIPIPRVIFSEEIFTGDKRRRRRVHQIFQQYLAEIADVLAEGQAKGIVRKEYPAETLSMMVLGLVQPAAILWVMNSDYDFTGHVQQAWSIFRKSIQRL